MFELCTNCTCERPRNESAALYSTVQYITVKRWLELFRRRSSLQDFVVDSFSHVTLIACKIAPFVGHTDIFARPKSVSSARDLAYDARTRHQRIAKCSAVCYVDVSSKGWCGSSLVYFDVLKMLLDSSGVFNYSSFEGGADRQFYKCFVRSPIPPFRVLFILPLNPLPLLPCLPFLPSSLPKIWLESLAERRELLNWSVRNPATE